MVTVTFTEDEAQIVADILSVVGGVGSNRSLADSARIKLLDQGIDYRSILSHDFPFERDIFILVKDV